MGNGAPNQGVWRHRQGGVIVGYRYIYHDQQITGDNYVHSPEVSPGAYHALRQAAEQGLGAFGNAVAGSAWGPFFLEYRGMGLNDVLQDVLDTL